MVKSKNVPAVTSRAVQDVSGFITFMSLATNPLTLDLSKFGSGSLYLKCKPDNLTLKLSTLSVLIKISFDGLKMGLENHMLSTISKLTIWVVKNFCNLLNNIWNFPLSHFW